MSKTVFKRRGVERQAARLRLWWYSCTQGCWFDPSASAPPSHPPFTSTSFQALQSILQYPLTVSTSQLLLPTVALKVGSTWQVNDNGYVTLLKFSLIGILDQLCLISPSRRCSVVSFPLAGTNSLLHCNTLFCFWPEPLWAAVHTVLRGVSPHNPPQPTECVRGHCCHGDRGFVGESAGRLVGCRGRRGGRVEGAGGGNSWCGSHHFKRAHLIDLEKI